MDKSEDYLRGWKDAAIALRSSHEFWTFMEGHPLGDDGAEFMVYANNACADFLEMRWRKLNE